MTLRLGALVALTLLVSCASPDPRTPPGSEPAPVATTPVSEPSASECRAESQDSFEGRAVITVTEPCAGTTVTSPLTIAGEANVFEATVSFRIVDEDGVEITSGFTTATCGTGCWGDFKEQVEFEVVHEISATLEVFESSAEDGSAIHVVSIPLTLSP